MKKKLFSILLATLVLVTFVFGSAFATKAPASNSGLPTKNGKYNPPITINLAAQVGDDVKFKNGETMENNVHTKWALNSLGINFKYQWVLKGTDALVNKLRLALSSNEKLPDIFMVNDPQLIADFIDSGRVMDITSAINKYASPRLKSMFKSFPAAFYPVNNDGKTYGIPRFSGGNISDAVMWIRQDWLNKLGLKQPKTLDELEKVMDAFVNKDPDGNGKNDTIGVSIGGKNNLGTWMASSSFIFGAYGATNVPGQWSLKGNTVQYASVLPETKMGLGRLSEWYQKGYLDKEFMIQDESKASESFVQGRSGLMTCGNWLPDWPLPDLLKNNPKAKVVPISTVKGANGKLGRWGEGLYTGHFMFSKDFKYIEAYFKYLDTLYSYQFGDGVFKDGLFNGYDYTIINKVPVYDQKKIPGGYVDPGRYFLVDHAPDIPYKQSELMAKIYKGLIPKTAFEKKIAAGNPMDNQAAAIIQAENKYKMISVFNGPPTETMRSQQDYLNKLEAESFAKILYGQESLEDGFNKFVKDWKANGGEQITKEVNAWYKSVSKK